MVKRPFCVTSLASLASTLALSFSVAACIEPPPKLASIPAGGLALRLHVFGASAEDALQSFESVKQNNQGFSIVNDGGDGEVLLGLEKDTGACVEPTALCAYRISYRIKNAKGDVIRADNELVSANSDRCTLICEKALNQAITKVVDHAALALKGGGDPSPLAAAQASASATPAADADAGAPDPKDKTASKKAAPPPPPPPVAKEPLICAIGSGPRLPSEEAEKRVGQVEALKRMGVLGQDESDCLRKAFLARL